MEKYYEFAGLGFAVCAADEIMYQEDRALAPFRVESCAEPHRFDFEMVEQLPPPEGVMVTSQPAFVVYRENDWTVRYIGSVQNGWDGGYIRAAHKGREHRVHLKASAFAERFGVKTVLNSMSAEHLIAQNRGFVFHSSFIEVDGKAILFTAPSGTGKSTQAALWEKYRAAEVINGDRSAVRLSEGKVLSCGVPFAGSSNICKNKTMPLGAVVYLRQAPQNRLRRMGGAEAFCRVWEGCSVNAWDKADVNAVSDTVQQVISKVPVYELACTPDEEAVKTLEETLKKEGIL